MAMSPLIKPDTPAPTNVPHLAHTRWASGSFMSKISQLYASKKLIVNPDSGQTATAEPETSRLTHVNREEMLLVSHPTSYNLSFIDVYMASIKLTRLWKP